LVSCTDKDKIPAGVLPKDKMEKVLWDIIQAERYRDTYVRDSSLDLKKETFKLYAQVFEIHQVSKDEFIKSYKFYMSRPDIARVMFDSLATRANRRREELYKPKALDTASIQKMDTLKQVDSAKAVKAPKPAAKPTVKPAATRPDTQRTGVLPQPPIPSASPDFRKRPNRFPLNKRLKIDSATRLQLKKQ
jgi:hypothetical protein